MHSLRPALRCVLQARHCSARAWNTRAAPSGEWLRAELDPAQGPDALLVTLGVGDVVLNTIGDVKSIEWKQQGGATSPVAVLHWTGFLRSDSDELYHATWKNTEGAHNVHVPVRGTVLALNTALKPEQLDCNAWLARLRVSRADWDTWERTNKTM